MATRADAVNILLVDDQPAKLLTYQTILAELGERLIVAGSAAVALEHLLRSEIAVVLVDVCMPELDGFELATMIRQHPRFQRTAIIFVSAVMLTDLDRLRGYEAGAVDYVPVPVVPEILRAKVGVFADLFRTTRELERLNSELEARVAERTRALEATTSALQTADRRKDEFLAMLAHELRNPLAPIRTAVHVLRMPDVAEDGRAAARDIIERQVEHLVTLIDDLLDVSRITRGVIALQREPVGLGTVVARAVETARPVIDARRHTLELALGEAPLVVDGDPTRLVQVVSNVIHNAAKFMDPGGRITVTAAAVGPQAMLVIADEGVGIPEDVMPTVFDLFSQGPLRSPGQGGLGIGLALVKRLTEMHGGTVGIVSAGPGRGTRVEITLPLIAAPVADVAHGAPPPSGPRRRILVADDNHDAATALSLLLEAAGHDVRIVFDGAAALDAAADFRPDVALLDVGMPTIDGYEAARRLRADPERRDLTLIALTGWGQPQDRERTAAAGFDLHLVKPVTDVDLFQALAAGHGPVRARPVP